MGRKIIMVLTILSVAFIGVSGLNKIMSEDEINEIVVQ